MKIDDKTKTMSPSDRLAAAADRDTGKAPPRTEQRATAPVHWSLHARKYQQARKALATVPDVDNEKVQAIRARVQSGRYRIEAEKIADKMIREALLDDD
ncbi:MAG: flagellar biosynthesis anti-sigma factor FlgM [Desulfobacterales bacterium]|jgi:flagellar biosynthesis anti-sigma factor FlgM